MKIFSYLLAFLFILINNVNTEETKKDGETQEIQAKKNNVSNYINNKGYGGDKYDGGQRPDGVVINNNDSEKIHGAGEDKETQQIQANRMDGSNYIYNRRYGVYKYDGGSRHDGSGIYSNDSKRKYDGSEEKETHEIQGNRTDSSNYIYNRRHSADKYDAGRRHVDGEINNNVSGRRYGVSVEEETEQIQANRTDGRTYVYDRRNSSVEYDVGRRHDGGGIYSNDSERRYGGSEKEDTVEIQGNRTDGSNYKYDRRYGGDKYDGGRKHHGGGRHRYRHDSGRRHGGNKGGKTREILDKIKDVGNKVKDIYNRNFGGDKSDGGRSYGDSRRYHGSQRRGYSQQSSNSQRHSYHPRHGDGGSKTNKLNTFIEYAVPVAQLISIMAPML